VSSELYQAFRFRSHAEELRSIAADSRPDSRSKLLQAADLYERLATNLELSAQLPDEPDHGHRPGGK
jgi:hypothetical protein